MNEHVLEVEGVTHYFGAQPVLCEVSFRLPRGSVLALLGRNGAGKSTLMRMLTGLLHATRGTARVLGHDAHVAPPTVRERVGYVPEGHPLFDHLRVQEAAALEASFYPRWETDVFERVLSTFGLRGNPRTRNLSRGQRAGLSLALTLAKRPELLILDDPTLGLDPVARRALIEELIRFRHDEDGSIFFASHELADVERLADAVLLLEEGQMRVRCSLDTLRSRLRQVALAPGGSLEELRRWPGVLEVVEEGAHRWLTVVDADGQLEERLAERGLWPAEMQEVSVEEGLLAFLRSADEPSGAEVAR